MLEHEELLVIAGKLENRGKPEFAALVSAVARVLAEADITSKTPRIKSSLPDLAQQGKAELTIDQVKLAQLVEVNRDNLMSNPSSRADKKRGGYRNSITRFKESLEDHESELLLDVVGRWVQVGYYSLVGMTTGILLVDLAAIAFVFGKITSDEAQVFFELRTNGKGLHFHSTLENSKNTVVTCSQVKHLLCQFELNDSQGEDGSIKISSLHRQANAAKKIILKLQN